MTTTDIQLSDSDYAKLEWALRDAKRHWEITYSGAAALRDMAEKASAEYELWADKADYDDEDAVEDRIISLQWAETIARRAFDRCQDDYYEAIGRLDSLIHKLGLVEADVLLDEDSYSMQVAERALRAAREAWRAGRN